MLKTFCPAATVLVALAASTVAQNPVVLPPYSTTYNGFSRGFNFTAPSNLIIAQMELPTNSFQAGDTGSYLLYVNGAPALYQTGVAPGGNGLATIATSVLINAGDDVSVIGNWSPSPAASFTAHNSYGTGGGTYTTSIEGTVTTLNRTGWQHDIGDPAYTAAAYLAPTSGSMGLINIYTTPQAGLFPSFTATPTVGASPLQVQFTDTTFTSDPGGVLTWEWDFDSDGIVDDTQQNPLWVYGACGSYDVTLTVTDATNGQVTTTVVGAVVVDQPVADFIVSELAPGSGLWQFTDMTTPAASSWDWDFDGDGIVDDTNQNPVYVQAVPTALLSLPGCTLTVAGPGGCFTDTLVRDVNVTGYGVAEGPSTGGNGTTSTFDVGTYFDIEVVDPEGVNITSLETAVYTFGGAMDCVVYVTQGTHVGKEGNADAWTLAASGSGVAAGGAAFTAPELVPITLNAPFFLPQGSYGVAMYNQDPAGGTMYVAYTNGPANAPYGNGDIIIHPNGVGCSSTSTLGPCAFSPRLWNGRLYYEQSSVTGAAAAGTYAAGCVNSAAVVPSLELASLPQLGTNYELDVDSGLAAPAATLMVLGFSKNSYNGLPLPLDLGVIGAPGCELATSAEATPVLIAQPGGGNIYSLSVPNNASLVGGIIYSQAAVLDVPANGLGFVLSNAFAMQMGN